MGSRESAKSETTSVLEMMVLEYVQFMQIWGGMGQDRAA